MATMNWEEVARDLAGALDSCVTQIQQMKGMFPDDDGNIEQALQEADDAAEIFSDAAAGKPKPRFYTHFKDALREGGPDAWERSADDVPCGRFAVQEEDVALFPELAGVDSVLVWDGGIETQPSLPDKALDSAQSATMSWNRLDKSFPPEQKNILVMLQSGIPLLGRNIFGRFCVYDALNDRMVEWMENDKDSFRGIVSWCEIHETAPAPSPVAEEAVVQSIAEKICDAGDENVLDDVLHDEFADQASAVNNSGLTAQIRYLIANDYDEQEILEKAGIATSPSCGR